MAVMPAIFFGHENPMNALLRNRYTERWSEIGNTLPSPKAILCVSAHWYVPGAAVTINSAPRTLHAFGGFPRELYDVLYPAPGNPELARRIQKLLAPFPVDLEERWGLDHGTRSVLCHVYRKRTFPSCNSASRKPAPPASTTTLASGWRLCAKKASSLWLRQPRP
jgi:4,5-DOPA dioxygenase extradiol